MFQLIFFGKGSCKFSGESHKVQYFNLSEYLSRLSFSSVSGQVAVAVGFLTRDPSLIWNNELAQENRSEWRRANAGNDSFAINLFNTKFYLSP